MRNKKAPNPYFKNWGAPAKESARQDLKCFLRSKKYYPRKSLPRSGTSNAICSFYKANHNCSIILSYPAPFVQHFFLYTVKIWIFSRIIKENGAIIFSLAEIKNA